MFKVTIDILGLIFTIHYCVLFVPLFFVLIFYLLLLFCFLLNILCGSVFSPFLVYQL